MKKRYLTLATLLAAGICLTFGVIAILPPRPGVTKANLNRIKVGMTKAEVETLLGKSTDSFTECTCSDRKSEAFVDLRFNADDVLVSMHVRDDTPLDKASANFKLRLTQLREGMKMTEVQGLFEHDNLSYRWMSYNEDGSAAHVGFDNDGKVSFADWFEPTESIGERFLRVIRWPWWR